VKAVLALLNILPAVWTWLRVVGDPILRLLEFWIAVLSHTVELLTSLAFVPWNRVSIAHLEATFFASNMGVHYSFVVVELSIGTVWA
jgi:hypothetical protein